MPTRAEFEEKKHKRSSLGTFAEKPAEPKARISLAPGAADPVTTAPTAPVRKLEEDEVPTTTPDGAKIVDYADGVAHYSDGSSYSAEGWKDSGLDVSYQGTDTVTEEQVSGRAATAKYGAKRRQAEQARAAVERAAIARERARRIEARRKQLRDRSAKQHGEPLDATYANFYGQFDKEGIKRLKDKYLWTVQDNSIEQNLVLARRLGWPTGKGKDGHTFIVTPWGNRYRGNKPKKPKKAKKTRAKKKAKPQGFWHGFTSSGGTVTIEELRARVHRTPIITASASDLRARVHGSKAVMATATSAWNSSARKGAAAKGIALPDGSYPIKDKTDWAKAKQALGRAKNRAVVVKHLMKRAKALGIPAEQYKGLTASSNTGMIAALGESVWDPLLHPRGRNGRFIEIGGWVQGLFAEGPEGKRDKKGRAKVTAIEPNPSDTTDPIIVVEMPDGSKGYANAATLDGSVPTKGDLSPEPGEGQMDLGDITPEDLLDEKGDLDYKKILGNPDAFPDVSGRPIAARLKEGDRIVFRESDAVTNVSGLKDGDVVEVFDIVRIPPDPAGKNPNGSVGIVTLNGLGPTYRSETLIELDNDSPEPDTQFANSPDDLYEGLYEGVGKEGFKTRGVDQALLDALSDDEANMLWEKSVREDQPIDDAMVGPKEALNRRAQQIVTNHLINKQIEAQKAGPEGDQKLMSGDVGGNDAVEELRQRILNQPDGSINESLRSAGITQGEKDGAEEAIGDPAVWIKESLMPLYSPYSSDSDRNIGRKSALERLAEAAGWRQVDVIRNGQGTYGLEQWIPPGAPVPEGTYVERGSGLEDARSHYLGGAQKYPNWNTMAGKWLSGDDKHFDMERRAGEWDITPDELRGILAEMSEQGALDEGKLFADDQGRERYDANEAALAERGAANEKVWRTDLAKVQQALEEGGWITSTPDADAPGGTFTYIDPDAPPELVALYQKLIQFGYANGYEP